MQGLQLDGCRACRVEARGRRGRRRLEVVASGLEVVGSELGGCRGCRVCKDVFVHISALERAGISSVAEGQKLEYELAAGRDGRSSAENLKLAD